MIPLLAHVYGVSIREVGSWSLDQYSIMVEGISKVLGGGKGGSSSGSIGAARSVGMRTPLGV